MFNRAVVQTLYVVFAYFRKDGVSRAWSVGTVTDVTKAMSTTDASTRPLQKKISYEEPRFFW